MTEREEPGPVETAVQGHISSLRDAGLMDTAGEALAALALNLAARLDAPLPEGMKGDPTASWSRELRATLLALAPKEAPGGDDDSWVAGLPAPVQHPSAN